MRFLKSNRWDQIGLFEEINKIDKSYAGVINRKTGQTKNYESKRE